MSLQLSCYDQAKQLVLATGLLSDNVFTHFLSSFIAVSRAGAVGAELGLGLPAAWFRVPGWGCQSCHSGLGGAGLGTVAPGGSWPGVGSQCGSESLQ